MPMTRLWVNAKLVIRKSQPADWIAIALLVIYVAMFSWMTIRQHEGFRTNALDLAKFDQAIWNTAQGRPFHTTLIRDSVIQSHFSPILALYAPLYWLWSDVRILFIAQSICLGGAGFLIYVFFRRNKATPWPGLIIYAAYLMHPALHQVNLAEFRRITTAVLATSFALYQMLGRRYGWMALGLAIALLSKEDMAFLTIGVGLYLILAHRSFKVGVSLLIAGGAWLVLVPFVVLPALTTRNITSSGQYTLAGKYFSYLGNSLAEILQNLSSNPTLILQYVLRPKRLMSVVNLCWPTAFLFLLAPEIAVFTLPFLGYLLASTSNSMGQLEAWYPSVILPMLYWAVAVGISRVRGRWQTTVLIILLVTGIGGWFANSEVWPGRRFQPERFKVTEHHRQVEVALQQIPADAVVAAQSPLVPHLSHRKQIYLFPWIPGGVQPDYVVLDREMNTYPTVLEAYRSLFYRLLAGTEYEIEQQVDSLYVFRYAGTVSPDVVCMDQWGESLTLTGYSIAVAAPGEDFDSVPANSMLLPGATVRLSLFWRVEQPIEQNYSVFVHLSSADGQLLAQHDGWPADAHRPTSVLPPGTVVRDIHYLSLSEAVPVDAVLRVGLYESVTGERWLMQNGQEAITLPLFALGKSTLWRPE
ncbi:MAG: DUF2079 domain-containing protein [Chloroflexota bacterium]|nr:DUF2079 domain-containing protein [Chloroflexota bacterium]